MKKIIFPLLLFYSLNGMEYSLAQNPLIHDQFTADPSARVFEGKVYVYPSHDIPCGKGQGIIGFCMADYHVFSSENLTEWVDHGIIISQGKVNWVDSLSYSMWAPDCIYKNGKYYFYFPAISKEKSVGKGMRIGIAISDKPTGPFIPETEPIGNVYGIDPNPFIDKDGQAYLYWAGMKELWMAKLNDNMKELASEPQKVADLTEKFKEGPYLFERNGIYYLTFPYVENKTESLVYAIGNNTMGPFEYKGVIMDESPTGCWTNHHSIIEYKGQWYLFYHHNDLSPEFDKNRSIKADSLFFKADGTIQKVNPSNRGIGITDARDKIQIDRYSDKSPKGISIDYIDQMQKQKGRKAILETKDSWIRYNRVNFGDKSLKSVSVNAFSKSGGIIEIRIDKTNGSLVARVKITKKPEYNIVIANIKDISPGIHDLFIISKENIKTEIDWISFE